MLDVCLLGCGGMMPLPKRWLTSLLLRYSGKLILIDCGEGTQVPLRLAGWGVKSLEAILFTHYHGDHIAGLPGLFLTMGNSGRTEPVKLYGPPGLERVVKCLTVIASDLPFEIEFNELSKNNIEQFDIAGIEFSSIPVNHSVPCMAYNLYIRRRGKFDLERAKKLDIPVKFWNVLQGGNNVEYEGKVYTPDMVLGNDRKGIKLTYCVDTRPVDTLKDFSQKSDLFVCEGMYGEKDMLVNSKNKKHMTFAEAAQIAKEAEVSEMWLVHFSPSMVRPEDYLDNAKSIFANTVLGKDLMKKTIYFEIDEE